MANSKYRVNIKPRKKPKLIATVKCNNSFHKIALINNKIVLLAHPFIEQDKIMLALKANHKATLENTFTCYKFLSTWKRSFQSGYWRGLYPSSLDKLVSYFNEKKEINRNRNMNLYMPLIKDLGSISSFETKSNLKTFRDINKFNTYEKLTRNYVAKCFNSKWDLSKYVFKIIHRKIDRNDSYQPLLQCSPEHFWLSTDLTFTDKLVLTIPIYHEAYLTNIYKHNIGIVNNFFIIHAFWLDSESAVCEAIDLDLLSKLSKEAYIKRNILFLKKQNNNLTTKVIK